MLVFGPYRAIPKDEVFTIYNLSSPVDRIPRLPGLIKIQPVPNEYFYDPEIKERFEKEFDMWYYNAILEDFTACSSLMQILMSLYNGDKVYVCICDYATDDTMTIINESFMKFIQARYDIKYSIINTPEDYEYVPKDGCDFMSVNGIMTFDSDRKEYIRIMEEMELKRQNGAFYGY